MFHYFQQDNLLYWISIVGDLFFLNNPCLHSIPFSFFFFFCIINSYSRCQCWVDFHNQDRENFKQNIKKQVHIATFYNIALNIETWTQDWYCEGFPTTTGKSGTRISKINTCVDCSQLFFLIVKLTFSNKLRIF